MGFVKQMASFHVQQKYLCSVAKVHAWQVLIDWSLTEEIAKFLVSNHFGL